jgi:transcriptional regulator with XRE-family HTH domain
MMNNSFQQKRLADLRQERKMTLQELANAIQSTKSYVWELENKSGIRPSADTVYKLAIALGVTVEDLMGDIPQDQEDQVFFREYKGLKSETKKQLKNILDALKKGE